MRWLFLLSVVLALAATETAGAQSLYGQRLRSKDGSMLLPVASLSLCSDSGDHTQAGRNSVPSWDICAPHGSAIYPAAAGKVILAACQLKAAHGYGCWVKLDHGGGITTAYAHMIEGSIRVRVGDMVTPDMIIGEVGWTGKTSFGPHTHFVIYYYGRHVDPGTIFDQSAMVYRKFATASGQPVAWNGATSGQTARQQGNTQYDSKGMRLLRAIGRIIAETGDEVLYALVSTVLFAILCVLWLSPRWVKIAAVCTAISLACSVSLILLFVPDSHGSQAAGDWQAAYRIVVASEGFSYTEDGARTMGGITQDAYSAWLASHGLPHADVRNLTEDQRQQIFYERYWMRDDIRNLSPLLKITAVDHVFNTGDIREGLAQCGNDVRCFNDWRVQDYRSMRTCHLYCAGWLNRVERIRSLTER